MVLLILESLGSTELVFILVMALVFCYVDLGLTSTRIPLLLGVFLGTVGVLPRIASSTTRLTRAPTR